MIPLDGGYGATIREMAHDLVTYDQMRDIAPFDRAELQALLGRFSDARILEGKQVQALLMLTLCQDGVRSAIRPAGSVQRA